MPKPVMTKETASNNVAVYDEIRKFMMVYVGGEMVEAYEVYSIKKREEKIKEILEKYAGDTSLQIKHKDIPDEYKITNQCPEGVCPVRVEKEEKKPLENTDTVELDVETGEPKKATKAAKKKKTAKKSK